MSIVVIVVYTPLNEHTQSIRTNEHTTEQKQFYLFEIKLDRQRVRGRQRMEKSECVEERERGTLLWKNKAAAVLLEEKNNAKETSDKTHVARAKCAATREVHDGIQPMGE